MSLPLAALSLAVATAPTPVALELTLQHHRFEPSVLRAPPGTRLELHVKNLDTTSEEIESYALNREKVVGPGKTVIIYLGPLEAGHYDLIGEDHPDTAQAVLEVR